MRKNFVNLRFEIYIRYILNVILISIKIRDFSIVFNKGLQLISSGILGLELGFIF